MMYIAITIVGILALFVIRTYIQQYSAKLNGVDAEAYVSLIQHEALHSFFFPPCAVRFVFL